MSSRSEGTAGAGLDRRTIRRLLGAALSASEGVSARSGGTVGAGLDRRRTRRLLGGALGAWFTLRFFTFLLGIVLAIHAFCRFRSSDSIFSSPPISDTNSRTAPANVSRCPSDRNISHCQPKHPHTPTPIVFHLLGIELRSLVVRYVSTDQI